MLADSSTYFARRDRGQRQQDLPVRSTQRSADRAPAGPVESGEHDGGQRSSMSLRLFHSALRLRIDLARGAGYVDRGRTGKLLLDLLRGHARIIRVIPIETLVSVPDRRIMARVGEHHGKRRSLGRLDEENGHVGVRDALRVRPERILPIASAHAPVHAEPGLRSPERQPCRLEPRKCASHRVERLVPDPIGCSMELPQFSLVEAPQDDRDRSPRGGRDHCECGSR